MISKNIKRLRLLHNLTLRQLAEKLDVHYSAISRWEDGSKEPRGKYRKQMAVVFGIQEIDLWR